MSYVIRAVKSPDFWCVVFVAGIIALSYFETTGNAAMKNAPDYDPCARYVDMPTAAASCYEDLVAAKEAKAKLKAINQTRDESR